MKPVRQAQITSLLDEQGALTVADLGRRLEVSEATIRRDLDSLAVDGLVIRTHGGAISAASLGREPPLLERHTVMSHEKAAIAARAAQMVIPGDTIFLGTGTTVALMAPLVASLENLTVISNSLPVIDALSNARGVDLIVIGGAFRRSELSMVGLAAVEAIRGYRADRVFMGMRAIDVKHGFTGDAIDEAITDRAVLEIGKQSIVLTDHSKFGLVSTVFLAPLDFVDLVITDSGIDHDTAAAAADAGMHLVITEGES